MPGFTFHSLWPIPVYESEITVKSEWLDYVSNTEYIRMQTGTADISKDKYILNNLPELKKEIETHCEEFMRCLDVVDNATFYLQNSWSVKINKGDKAAIHGHSSSLVSGVYYLKKENINSGNLSFHKNQSYINTFPDYITGYDNSATFHSTSGTILLFPSHLEHSVEENESNETRYSLAFNFYVRGKFGKDEYYLEIK